MIKTFGKFNVLTHNMIYCLHYYQVRARNQFVYGEWSQPETISLDAGCSISNASNTTVSPMPDVIKMSNESKSQSKLQNAQLSGHLGPA